MVSGTEIGVYGSNFKKVVLGCLVLALGLSSLKEQWSQRSNPRSN